jgi:hypothetical protein
MLIAPSVRTAIGIEWHEFITRSVFAKRTRHHLRALDYHFWYVFVAHHSRGKDRVFVQYEYVH